MTGSELEAATGEGGVAAAGISAVRVSTVGLWNGPQPAKKASANTAAARMQPAPSPASSEIQGVRRTGGSATPMA